VLPREEPAVKRTKKEPVPLVTVEQYVLSRIEFPRYGPRFFDVTDEDLREVQRWSRGPARDAPVSADAYRDEEVQRYSKGLLTTAVPLRTMRRLSARDWARAAYPIDTLRLFHAELQDMFGVHSRRLLTRKTLYNWIVKYRGQLDPPRYRRQGGHLRRTRVLSRRDVYVLLSLAEGRRRARRGGVLLIDAPDTGTRLLFPFLIGPPATTTYFVHGDPIPRTETLPPHEADAGRRPRLSWREVRRLVFGVKRNRART
jgi:hypothetical protein